MTENKKKATATRIRLDSKTSTGLDSDQRELYRDLTALLNQLTVVATRNFLRARAEDRQAVLDALKDQAKGFYARFATGIQDTLTESDCGDGFCPDEGLCVPCNSIAMLTNKS